MTASTVVAPAPVHEMAIRTLLPHAAEPLWSGRIVRRRLLLVTDTATRLKREITALTNVGGLCLPVETEANVVRAARWKPDLALVLGARMSLARRAEWLYALRSTGSALVVLVLDDASIASPDDERIALELGFDAVWEELGSPGLLCSRVLALQRLRRDCSELQDARSVSLGDLRIDLDSPVAQIRGRTAPLSVAQVRALHALATAPVKVVSRSTLAAAINGYRKHTASTENNFRSVDMFMLRLRRRLRQLGASSLDIITVRGVGYQLVLLSDA